MWSARRRGRYLHNTQKAQEPKTHALSGIGTRDISNQVATDLRFRPHGYRDRPAVIYNVECKPKSEMCCHIFWKYIIIFRGDPHGSSRIIYSRKNKGCYKTLLRHVRKTTPKATISRHHVMSCHVMSCHVCLSAMYILVSIRYLWNSVFCVRRPNLYSVNTGQETDTLHDDSCISFKVRAEAEEALDYLKMSTQFSLWGTKWDRKNIWQSKNNDWGRL